MRLLTVACGLTLATLATPALARPHDIPGTGGGYSDSDSYEPRSYSGGERRSRRSSNRAGKRYTGKRTSRRYVDGGRRGSRASRRGITAYARGGASRSCLTGAARALLGRIEARFGSMQIISTCRPGARIAGSGRISRHASGNAVDFNSGGRKGEVVRWLIANHKSGGTMTYRGMSHIHVDIGHRFVSLSSR
jgi:hypothetical protein